MGFELAKFSIVWLEMDFNDSEKIEVKTLQQRHTHIASISIDKEM